MTKRWCIIVPLIEQTGDGEPLAQEQLSFICVYFRRPHANDKCLALVSSLSDPAPHDLDLHINLRKGKHQCSLSNSTYLIVNYISYDHLSSLDASLLAYIDSISYLR